MFHTHFIIVTFATIWIQVKSTIQEPKKYLLPLQLFKERILRLVWLNKACKLILWVNKHSWKENNNYSSHFNWKNIWLIIKWSFLEIRRLSLLFTLFFICCCTFWKHCWFIIIIFITLEVWTSCKNLFSQLSIFSDLMTSECLKIVSKQTSQLQQCVLINHFVFPLQQNTHNQIMSIFIVFIIYMRFILTHVK